MKELFQLLKTRDMSPNSLYLLYCQESGQKVELPISVGTEIKKLQLMEMLSPDLALTDEAKLLLIEAEQIFIRAAKKNTVTPEFKEKLLEYRNLFPTTKAAGKLVRNAVQDLEQRMGWFIKTYPDYSWEIILNATRKYVESHNGDYKYCMTSAYFIKKDDKNKASLSLLSSWCEAELEEDSQDQTPPAILGFNRLV